MVWLKSQGHELRVFAGSGGWLAEQCQNAEISFTELKHLKREINPYHDLLAIREMRNALRDFKPDAVHLNTPGTLLARRHRDALRRRTTLINCQD